MRPDDQRSGQRWRRGRDPDPDGVALAATVAAGVLLGGCAAVAAGTHATPLAVLLALAAAGLAAMPLSEAAERPVLAGAMVLVTLDRKSTRLNSSHRTISYAVFCLKKK